MRVVRFAVSAGVAAIGFLMLASRATVVHADVPVGLCQSWTHADAYSDADPSITGSSDDAFSITGYTQDDCLGLADAEANFQAGLACDNAGIPAGLVSGVGYAVATWFVIWTAANLDDATRLGPLLYFQQQYDCADTFS